MTEYKSGNWGSYEANIYSSPEKCGLKVLASMEREPDYDFNIAILLQDVKTKSLWAAHDSGCSCPSPFEDFHSFADLTPIRTEASLANFVNQFEYRDGSYGYVLAEKQDFLRKGRAALRKRG